MGKVLPQSKAWAGDRVWLDGSVKTPERCQALIELNNPCAVSFFGHSHTGIAVEICAEE